MKKFISLILTLALALTLSAPALAIGSTEISGLSDQQSWESDWLDAHPDAAAAFDADAWFQRNYSGWTKDEYMDYLGLSDEADFRQNMFSDYLEAEYDRQYQNSVVSAYLQEHPDALDDFDALSYLRDRFDYPDPKTAFMSDYGLTNDQEFIDFLQYSYITDLQDRQDRKDTIAAYEAQNPDATAAFDAETYFSEQYPYYPKDQFMRDWGLATQEDFHDFLLSEWIVSQLPDSNVLDNRGFCDEQKASLGGMPGELGIMVNGTYLSFSDGNKPYAENGVTYVPTQELTAVLGAAPDVTAPDGYSPLRACAESAGFEVYWDPCYETAVLLDPDALAQTIDKNYTVLNGLLENWSSRPDRQKGQTDLNMTLTLFDSLDGDKTYPMSLTQTEITGPEGAQITGSYDFAAISPLLSALEDTNSFLTVDSILSAQVLSGNYELRMDKKIESAFLSASFLTPLSAFAGSLLPKNSWISFDLTSLKELPAADEVTAGSVLWAFYQMQSAGWSSPAEYWSDTVELSDSLSHVLGDGQFTQEAGNSVLRMDGEDLAALLTGTSENTDALGLDQFELEAVIAPNGKLSGHLLLQTESDSVLVPVMRITSEWAADPQSGSLSMEVHVKNLFSLNLKLTEKSRDTSQVPETLPPQYAKVIPLDEMTD